jgi:hypothetical protein
MSAAASVSSAKGRRRGGRRAIAGGRLDARSCSFCGSVGRSFGGSWRWGSGWGWRRIQLEVRVPSLDMDMPSARKQCARQWRGIGKFGDLRTHFLEHEKRAPLAVASSCTKSWQQYKPGNNLNQLNEGRYCYLICILEVSLCEMIRASLVATPSSRNRNGFKCFGIPSL